MDLNQAVQRLIQFARTLGNVELQNYKTRSSIYMVPRIPTSQGDSRIVGIVELKHSINLHLSKNEKFRHWLSRQPLNWRGAYSIDTRGYTYLNHIDTEKRLKIGMDAIAQAYRRLWSERRRRSRHR